MSATGVPAARQAAQVSLNRLTPAHRRVVISNPPLNLMGPEFVTQIRDVVTTLEEVAWSTSGTVRCRRSLVRW
jgi:hypothetical protein